MRKYARWFLLLSLLLLFVYSSPVAELSASKEAQTGFCEKWQPCKLLTLADAEKLLGQPARLTQDASEMKGSVRQCRCVYTGISKDPASGQDVNLFFSIEQNETSPSVDQAHQVLKTIKDDNIHDSTIIDLPGIGDEAFQLGDSPNVHFVLARKGPILLRLQIKQATEKSSLEGVKAFVRETAKRL
jgi:hypothetical protein